jgi:hypothetical protein
MLIRYSAKQLSARTVPWGKTSPTWERWPMMVRTRPYIAFRFAQAEPFRSARQAGGG